MKLVKSSNNFKIKLSFQDWLQLGRNGKWLKTYQYSDSKSVEFDMEIEDANGQPLSIHILAEGEVYPADPSVGYFHPHIGYWDIYATGPDGNFIQLSLENKKRAEEMAASKIVF